LEVHVFRTKLAATAALAVAACLLIAGSASARGIDRNHDKLPDRWEAKHGLSLKVKQARRDQDGDGLKNRGEFRAGLDPRDDDTDNDGIEDGDENAGTVESFKDGVLTIALAGGGKLTGDVAGDTEIDCEDSTTATKSDDDGDEGDREDGDREDGEHGDRDDGDDEQGDHDDGDREDGGDDEGDDASSCGPEALTVGRTVKEASLRTRGGHAVFDEIELG
jgi:hypothetical protein